MGRSYFLWLSMATAVLALVVILVGAYVRLSNAGLGCPDWPGCYGGLQAPSTSAAIEMANEAFPQRPVEVAKAWKEMVHRYFAATLGILILVLAVWAWRRRHLPGQVTAVPLVLLGLVILQSLLGMWTVTLLVKPAIVTAHLLGGISIVALAWWATLRQGEWFAGSRPYAGQGLRIATWVGIALVGVQISLGGWTSTNYAALSCVEFPTCNGGLWLPPTDFREAFVIWREVGIDYEYGVLDSTARTAIHISHRIGALVVTVYLSVLGWRLAWRTRAPVLRNLGLLLVLVLLIQVALGITNVLAHLPLPVAVAHNGGAVMLLLILVTLVHSLSPESFVSYSRHESGSDAENEKVLK